MSRYLVTGGAGFIGSHIVEAILRDGDRTGVRHEVRVIDDLSSGSLENLSAVADRVEFHRADVRDRSAIRALFRGVDYVFHDAALVSVFESVDKPLLNHEINVTGTLNVFESAVEHGARRLVLASSSAVYGNDPALPKTESMAPMPESPYGVAKITKEYLARVYSLLYRLPAISLRYFNVYGPRQKHGSPYSGVISIFVRSVLDGASVAIYGDGGQTRDFVFVEDVASANLLAMHSTALFGGETLNIGTGKQTSLLELLGVIDSIAGKTTAPELRPARAGDIRHSFADISMAGKAIGFRPRFGIHEGLTRLIESCR